jgi:hypothetical protein
MAGYGRRASPHEDDSQINKFINQPTCYAPIVALLGRLSVARKRTEVSTVCQTFPAFLIVIVRSCDLDFTLVSDNVEEVRARGILWTICGLEQRI